MEDSKTWTPRRPDAPRVIEIQSPLPPEWCGWQLRGNYLVAPDGTRIHRRRVTGLAWRYEMELRRAGYASQEKADKGKRGAQYGPKVKVLVIDLADYRENGLAAG